MNTSQTKQTSLKRHRLGQKKAMSVIFNRFTLYLKIRNLSFLFLMLFINCHTLKAQNVYYGMTSAGGTGAGRIFSYTPGSNLTSVFVFSGANGREPRGNLLQASDGKLYGLTMRGGSSDAGVLFSFDRLTNTYTVLHQFQPASGAFPTGSLMEGTDGRLYGVTLLSGASFNQGGVLFAFNPQNNQYQVLYDFLDAIQVPIGTPLQASNGKLYGLCVRTGTFGAGGGLYSFDVSTNTFSVLRTFSDNSGGFNATELYRGSLIQAANGKLYGTTSKDSDTGNAGSLFSFDIESNTFTRLHNFNSTNGRNPLGGVMQASDGKLYGLTVSGGSSNGGVMYSYDIDNQSFNVLENLTSGSFPTGEPLEGHDGRLYYLTLGSSNLFAYNLVSNTNQYITSASDNPYGNLILYNPPCNAPTAQATSINMGTPTSTTLTLESFTAPAGEADGYAIYIHNSNSFTPPADGDEPVADLSWNGAGQQPVYFGTSTTPNITITGLSTSESYYITIYAYNDCSGTETYETTGTSPNLDQDGDGIDIRLDCDDSDANVGLCPPSVNKIYWTDANPSKLQSANFDGTFITDLIIGGNGRDYLDIDFNANKIYWVEGIITGLVKRADLDGSNEETLYTLSGFTDPYGFALDVGAGKMYWSDLFAIGGNVIQRANLDGTGVETIVTSTSLGGGNVGDMAIDASAGKIYWTNRNADKIQRADLDGTNIEDLISTGLSSPEGIDLDLNSGKIYWTDAGTGKIQRADLDGSNIEDLVTGLSTPQGITLDVMDNKMYWVDSGTDKVQRANLDGTSVEDLVTTGLGFPRGIVVYPTAFPVLTNITTTAIPADTYCQGASISIGFTTTGTFNAGNVFTAELSDGSGSFSTPTNIGSITLGGVNPAGVIPSTIPTGTLSSSGYKIRVVSSSPSVIESDNQVDINIGGSIQVICKQYSAFLDGSGTNSITINDIDDGSTATCGIASMSLSQTTFDAVGTYTITLSVEDNLGNIATCETSVNITLPPQMYAIKPQGGTEEVGAIIEYNLLSNEINEVFSMPSGLLHGGRPEYTRLVEYQDKFYGMTSSGGGITHNGVIFEWNPANNQYNAKVMLNGSDGRTPKGSLTLYNGKFYGMTSQGGANDVGVIFEWNPQTNEYTKHFDFSNANGAWPYGSLVLRDGIFYGMTVYGGSNNVGVIFEWNPATNVYTKKIDLSTALGSYPYGDLTLEGNLFYGITNQGGENNKGVIFSWNPTDNTYTKLHDFNGADGAYSHGSLTAHNGKLYGMTLEGGDYDRGTIFEWDIAGGTYSLRRSMYYSFSFGDEYGEFSPYGNLVWENGFFYGFTSEGGVQNENVDQQSTRGTIFRWNPDNNDFEKIYDFNGFENYGMLPKGTPTFKDGKMYGLTNDNFVPSFVQGGINAGSIFEFDLSNGYTTKIAFNTSNSINTPIYPNTFTVQDGKFYGTTRISQLGAGDLFEWNPISNSIVRVTRFPEQGMGMPQKPTLFRGKLIGSFMVPSQDNPYAGVYTSNEVGNFSGYTWYFYDYPGSFGDGYGSEMPRLSGYFTPKGNLLYSTVSGLSAGLGRILSIDPVSAQVQEFYAFTQNVQGSYPVGPLILKNDKFYGVTSTGGANNQGVIYELDFTTKAYRKLHDFNNAGGNGRFPTNHLTIKNNKLYGIAGGGANNGGIIFEYNLETQTFIKKFDFSDNEPPVSSGSETGSEDWLWVGEELYGVSSDRLFKWNPASNVYTSLINFSNNNRVEGLTLVPNTLIGGNNSDWNDPSNWSSGSVPSSIDNVVIPEGVQMSISSNIEIGNLVLAQGATLIIEDNAQLEIATNFKADGTVIVRGSTLKTLPETLSDVYNLIIDNDTTVNLSGQLFVRGTLTVQNGYLNLNGNDLDLGYNGTLVEDFTNNHYIIDSTAIDANSQGGAVIARGRTVSNDPSNVAGLGIELSREAGNDYTVDVIRYHYAGLLGGIPRIYGITGNATGTNTSIRINYTDELIGDIDPNNLRMFRYSDEVAPLGWTEVSNPLYPEAVVSVGLGYVEVSNINSFSDWTLADATVALPISLLSFTGKAIDENTAELNWKTVSESNNQGFEIQKSKDAQSFEVIGFVEGAGNSNTLLTYTYLDPQAQGINYYRLKQIDFDGKYSYSPIVAIENALKFEVFPNPFTTILHLRVGGSTTNNEIFTAEISDIQGKTIFKASHNLNHLEAQCSKVMQQVTSGVYILKLSTKTKQYIKKLIKE